MTKDNNNLYKHGIVKNVPQTFELCGRFGDIYSCFIYTDKLNDNIYIYSFLEPRNGFFNIKFEASPQMLQELYTKNLGISKDEIDIFINRLEIEISHIRKNYNKIAKDYLPYNYIVYTGLPFALLNMINNLKIIERWTSYEYKMFSISQCLYYCYYLEMKLIN